MQREVSEKKSWLAEQDANTPHHNKQKKQNAARSRIRASTANAATYQKLMMS